MPSGVSPTKSLSLFCSTTGQNMTATDLPALTPRSSVQATKRKLEDAIIQSFVAVSSSTWQLVGGTADKPPLAKRPHISRSRSLYSTLAKYGTESRADARHSSLPTLPPILARTASCLLKVCRPIRNQVWMDERRKGHVGMWEAQRVAGASRTVWYDQGNRRAFLVDMHKEGCPWKTRHCDDSVYRVPPQPPSFTARDLRTTAVALDPIVSKFAIKHPHASSQLSSLWTLRLPGSTTGVPTPPSGDPSAMHVDENATPTSNTSFIVALSVWKPATLSSSHDRRHTIFMSAPHSGSFAASASMSPTPALSRASSVSRRSASQIQLNASPVRSCRTNDAFPNSASAVRLSTSSTSAKDVSLVHCPLRQRLVGLWSFATVTLAEEGSTREEQQLIPLSSASGKSVSVFALAVGTSGFQTRRPLDVLKEHRSYCPYVIRWTVVPSLPPVTVIGTYNVSDNGGGLVEGWRPTLTVVKQRKLSQRQRMSRFVPGSESAEGT
ncbi:hypothetical protein F5141DRAFT_1204549 [Pisolithus sp. B1]|nr:hypothetical protein F5141DRAFT_1204549 [Pisolithus sp. B1]